MRRQLMRGLILGLMFAGCSSGVTGGHDASYRPDRPPLEGPEVGGDSDSTVLPIDQPDAGPGAVCDMDAGENYYILNCNPIGGTPVARVKVVPYRSCALLK